MIRLAIWMFFAQFVGSVFGDSAVPDTIGDNIEDESQYSDSVKSGDSMMERQDWLEYGDEYERPEPTDSHDKQMLAILDEACGSEIYKYVSVDMDKDGANEMVGVRRDDHSYDVWYCSSDMETYGYVMPVQWYDDYNFELMDMGDEVHVVIDGANLLGDYKSHSILTLHDGQLDAPVFNLYGYVYMNDEGDIILEIEEYDKEYNITNDKLTGFTHKDTYLYYDDGKYKEYGAAELSEEDFLKYDNARELIDVIKEAFWEEWTAEIRFSYFIRENGIVHIQCEAEHASPTTQWIDYFYFTLRENGEHLDGDLVRKKDGIIRGSMSQLDIVTYPQ